MKTALTKLWESLKAALWLVILLALRLLGPLLALAPRLRAKFRAGSWQALAVDVISNRLSLTAAEFTAIKDKARELDRVPDTKEAKHAALVSFVRVRHGWMTAEVAAQVVRAAVSDNRLTDLSAVITHLRKA